jgi:hypothetical protein
MVFLQQLKLISFITPRFHFNLHRTFLIVSNRLILLIRYMLQVPYITSDVSITAVTSYYPSFVSHSLYAAKNFTKHNTYQNYLHYYVRVGGGVNLLR